MRKLLKNSAIIILCIVIADFSVGILGNYFVKNLPDYGDNLITKPNFALHKAKADVLILGSSRAEHHYNTQILKNRFPNYEIYNAGQHNQGMNYALCVLQSCLDRKIPKMVILDCEPEVLSEEITNSNSTLKLFYNQNAIVKRVLNKHSDDRIVLQSNFYKYNSVILKLLLDLRLSQQEDTLSGYEPLVGTIDTAKTKYTHTEFSSVLEDAEKDFKDIILLCKQHNIKLYVVVSPYYYHQNEMMLPYVHLKQICREQNIQLFDYMNHSFFDSRPQLFYDVNHLNKTGAELFTYQLFYDISRRL